MQNRKDYMGYDETPTTIGDIMETTENSTETLVEETEELSLRDEAVKTLVLTAAATAGMWGTLLVGGYAYGKIKARREAKAEAQKLHEIVNNQE